MQAILWCHNDSILNVVFKPSNIGPKFECKNIQNFTKIWISGQDGGKFEYLKNRKSV